MNWLLLFCLPLATEILDLDMTTEERRKTGVQTLTGKQKQTLQLWIDNHYEKREIPLDNKLSEKKLTVDQIECKGKETLLHLSDGTCYQIRSKDAAIAQSWINPEAVIFVRSGKDPLFPTLLTNTLSGSSVNAFLLLENF